MYDRLAELDLPVNIIEAFRREMRNTVVSIASNFVAVFSRKLSLCAIGHDCLKTDEAPVKRLFSVVVTKSVSL